MTLPFNCPPDGIGLAEYYTTGPGGECVKQASFFGGKPPLQQWIGYIIVLGFGALFAVGTSYLIHLEKKYTQTKDSSEWFNTAGRSVKTGLIASVIVSQWTWAATILQSSNVAFQDGVSGPFWYASGATVQVLLFGVMAIEVKRKAPNAHTICEIIKARWGTVAHIVFLCFCLLTNVLVTSMLLLGGASVVTALTGVNVYLASFLIPLGVIVYTLHGGLKATFLASYLHSVFVHFVLCLFIYLVYTSSSKLGSPSVVYKKLMAVTAANRNCSLTNPGQHCGPVSGNKGGSYLTMMSMNGFVFGIINVVGNFGTVFVDNGYWMSAIAARPSSTHRGYLLGGMVWFAVPFSLGTSLGLAALALDLPLTASEASKGLVPPAAAAAVMGNAGSVLLLCMLFMAVTSAGSSEMIAVSSLITYDVYRTYINPKATGAQILGCSRIFVLVFGLFMGVLAVALQLAGVSLGWMYVTMGTLIGSAVVPVALLLLWSKANAIGAVAGVIIGQIAAVTAWLTVVAVEYGYFDLDVTGRNAPALVGNLTAIIVSGTVHVTLSFIWPQNFDWEATKALSTVESDHLEIDPDEMDPVHLDHAKNWILKWGGGISVLILIVWPLLSLPAGVFSEGYFTFWAVLSIIWGTVGSAIIVVLPLVESYDTLLVIAKGWAGDLGKSQTKVQLDDIGLKMNAILSANPEAERLYLLEKERSTKGDLAPMAVEMQEGELQKVVV